MIARRTLLFSVLTWLLNASALAQDPQQGDPATTPEDDVLDPEALLPEEDWLVLPELEVTYKDDDVFRQGGSMQQIDEASLEKFEFDDPNAIVQQAPGLYTRQEDGFGLRPNIGIRGTSSDRSKKITLMEDDVLFGPAPYAAPAAYYFPLVTRMVGVDVFKGPSAVLYGPNTIGGALNFRSRPIPDKFSGELDVSLGSFWTRRLHGHVGAKNDWGGILFEGVDLASQGFKELPGGADTGFHRNEFLLKTAVNTDPEKEVFHKLELRLGYSRERSNETYTGLADVDFEQNPVRRYPSTARDQMSWWRTQVQLRHLLSMGDQLEVRTVFYRHDFDRTWTRLNGFRDGPSISDVLQNPTGRREVYYRVLTGEQDSASVLDPSQDGQDLLVIDNARAFVSQGLQSTLRASFDTAPLAHHLEVGARVHHDRIDRNHVERGYRMDRARLVRDGRAAEAVTLNTGNAQSLALYAAYGIEFAKLTITPGIRMEWIRTTLSDALTQGVYDNSDVVFIPGLGIQYQVVPELEVFAGVHRGFSPVAPGQPDEVEPERSTNYELGGRLQANEGATMVELTGFFNDYSNLTGNCTFSTGCSVTDIDRQFNGGEVDIFGLELAGVHAFELDEGLRLPVRGSYSFTHARFRSDFSSDNPTFGDVENGDEVPYVPEHQFRAQVGVEHTIGSANIAANYVGSMREQAGQGDPEPGELPSTDAYFTLDALATYHLANPLDLYLRFENITDASPIVARRPFGARPLKPFTVMIGARLAIR